MGEARSGGSAKTSILADAVEAIFGAIYLDGGLEAAGVITRHRTGRRNHYEIDVTTPMRHPLEEEKTVGDLLAALIGRKEAAALGLRGGRKRKPA